MNENKYQFIYLSIYTKISSTKNNIVKSICFKHFFLIFCIFYFYRQKTLPFIRPFVMKS